MTEIQRDAGLIAERYQLRSMIGRGGTGAVWHALDHDLGRSVAIKQIVTSEHRSTRSRERARREAQAVAQLRTPGVVQVFDVIDAGPYVYIVMELVDAPSLSRVVRRDGPMEPVAAAALGRSILATLDHIHRAGVIHRDVKPSNILLDGGAPRLTDFGIALFGDGPTLTAAGSVLGTPAYMAPEQALGQRPGAEADLYGLGATLYFAVEGRAPFAEANSWETTQAVRSRPHRPGTRLGPLEPLIDALLAKDPADRPAVGEIDAALTEVAGDLPPPTRPDTAPLPPLRLVVPPPAATADARPGTTGARADAGARAGALEGAREDARAGTAGVRAGARSASGARAGADARAGAQTGARPSGVAERRHSDTARPDDRPIGVADLTSTGEDGRQTRRMIVWTVLLLALLALALALLFVAVRGRAAGAVEAAAVAVPAIYHGRTVRRPGSRSMEQINAMRAVLVAGAVIAAVVAAIAGFWSATAVLAVGVLGHALLWRHLRRAPSKAPTQD